MTVSSASKDKAPAAARRIGIAAAAPRKRPSGRPTADQSDQIGDILIQAALASFMDRGFEGTTMDAIAKDAHVARITVYRRFGDKRELFRQVSHLALQKMNNHLRESMLAEGPPEVVLRSMIHRLLDMLLQSEFLSIMRLTIFESGRFPEIAQAYWGEVDYGIRPLTEYLHELQEDRLISIPDARDAALQFITLAVGGMRHLLVNPSMSPTSRAHWVEAVYTTFARAWGLDSSHLKNIAARVVKGKPAHRSRPKTVR